MITDATNPNNLQELNIRVPGSSVVVRSIPNIALELAPEYPNDWFNSHTGRKPIALLPKSGLTPEQILQKMGDTWISDPDIEPTLEFMFEFIKSNMKEKLTEPWCSYGRIIGDRGDQVTPIDLLDIEYYHSPAVGPMGSKLNPEDYGSRFAMIVSIYRSSLVMGSLGDYPTRVIKQMEIILKEPPYKLTALDPGLLSTKASWASNETFRKLIAATDMFYNKFRDSPYAKIKVATLPARDKDCGGLIAIKDLGSYLGVGTVTALSYVMDPRVVPELLRLTHDVNESCQQDSYFHYLRVRIIEQEPL